MGSEMCIRDRESTIEQHSLPVGAADDMAEPMAAFLTLTLGVEQEVEGNIGLRQLPPEFPEHVEAVIARWMCAAISVIRCSIDRSVVAMGPFCSEVVGVVDLQQRSFAGVGVAGVEAVKASGCYSTPILVHNTTAWPRISSRIRGWRVLSSVRSTEQPSRSSRSWRRLIIPRSDCSVERSTNRSRSLCSCSWPVAMEP